MAESGQNKDKSMKKTMVMLVNRLVLIGRSACDSYAAMKVFLVHDSCRSAFSEQMCGFNVRVKLRSCMKRLS